MIIIIIIIISLCLLAINIRDHEKLGLGNKGNVET